MATEPALWGVCENINTHAHLCIQFWNFGAYLEPCIQYKSSIPPCVLMLGHRGRARENEALHWGLSEFNNLEMVVVVLFLF